VRPHEPLQGRSPPPHECTTLCALRRSTPIVPASTSRRPSRTVVASSRSAVALPTAMGRRAAPSDCDSRIGVMYRASMRHFVSLASWRYHLLCCQVGRPFRRGGVALPFAFSMSSVVLFSLSSPSPARPSVARSGCPRRRARSELPVYLTRSSCRSARALVHELPLPLPFQLFRVPVRHPASARLPAAMWSMLAMRPLPRCSPITASPYGRGSFGYSARRRSP